MVARARSRARCAASSSEGCRSPRSTASTAWSTSAQVTPGRSAPSAALRAPSMWSNRRRICVGRLADDHRPLELGVVAPDRSARLADEDVAGLEGDVVRDRMRPRAALADLAAVAGRDTVRRGEAAAVGRAERVMHGERRLVSGAESGRGLRRAGNAVLLQQPVRVAAPAAALADQLDLGRALADEHRLEQRRERRDRAADRLARATAPRSRGCPDTRPGRRRPRRRRPCRGARGRGCASGARAPDTRDTTRRARSRSRRGRARPRTPARTPSDCPTRRSRAPPDARSPGS